MTYLKIINPTPGPSTAEQILQLVQSHATGITLRELSRCLNRPVSMLQICLKQLTSAGHIHVRQSKTGKSLIYYPRQKVKNSNCQQD